VPTNRRKRLPRRRQDVAELDEDLEIALLTGRPYFGPYPAETLADAWRVHGDRLVREYKAGRPGRRPFWWWMAIGVPRYGERPVVDPRYVGQSRDDLARWMTLGILHTDGHPPMQEFEEEFLDRVGVITHQELLAGRGRRQAWYDLWGGKVPDYARQGVQ
jgi:hypothetical protein